MIEIINWIGANYTYTQITTTAAVVTLVIGITIIFALYKRWEKRWLCFQSLKSNAPWGHGLALELVFKVILPSACIIGLWIGSVLIYIFT